MQNLGLWKRTMNAKQIKIIFLLILGCFILYNIIIGQINSKLVDLNIQITELEENYNIVKSKTNSIKSEIEALLSIRNLDDIAKEKNFNKPTKEQKIVLKNDKDKTE